MARSRLQDPDSRLDHKWDWADPADPWLDADADEIITDAEVFCADEDVEITDVAFDDSVVTAWIEGGTVGTEVQVTCRIETSEGRRDDRSVTIRITHR